MRQPGQGAPSHAWPLHVAVAETLSVDAALAAMLAAHKANPAAPAIYNGAVPEGAPFPYVLLGDTGEGALTRPLLMRDGSAVSILMHVYAPGTLSGGPVLEIYDRLRALLHQTGVLLEDRRLMRGTLSLVTVLPDPDADVMHAVVRYDADVTWHGGDA
jgi:hypothetical protein